MEIEKITWEQILPIWQQHLWPDRVSPIEPVSAMRYLGGYDLKLQEEEPIFFGMLDDDGTIYGVNSIVKTRFSQFRSRGLWVDPAKRRQGLARQLLERSMEEVRQHDAHEIWSAPRESALPVYEAVGFRRTSSWFYEGMEFGPNCYVLAFLDDDDV